MIRFCNRETISIEYSAITKKVITDYFLSDCKDNILCVYNNFNTMKWVGIITYDSFNKSSSIDEAIKKEYVIFDVNMWIHARKHFEWREKMFTIDSLLPVLDKEYKLIGFAYEDIDANHEMRMLRELYQAPKALQFTDVYPECKGVKIWGFNELAFFFVKYLQTLNIPFEVNGHMWDKVVERTTHQVPDYGCMEIYAERLGEYDEKELHLRTASVEFECIDRIYEENIRYKYITDSEGDFLLLLEKIRNEKEIVIIGTGIYSLNAYDLLTEKKIDILFFMSEDQRDWGRRLFGKKILSKKEIIYITKKPIFIECCSENSAWGFGEVDRYDYEGYRRNEQYFCLKDYIEISIGKLPNALKAMNVILLGNQNLCSYVKRALTSIGCNNITIWSLSKEICEGTLVRDKDIVENSIGLIVEPPYYCDISYKEKVSKRKRLYYEVLVERGINNITQYFSEREVLLSISKDSYSEKYPLSNLRPRSILLNISGHMCGNDFFSNLLDGHPNVVQIDWGMESIRSNLFLICIQLAEEKASEIVKAFWTIYETITTYEEKVFLERKEKFDEKFRELLRLKDQYTSQELFVILHIAYAVAWGQKVLDMQEMLIYHEQREAPAKERPFYEEWLCDKKVKGVSINITRNAYTRVGSFFRHLERFNNFSYLNISGMWNHMLYADEVYKMPDTWKRLEVKFETIKTKPEETLACICESLELPWNDSVLETTSHGKIAKYTTGNSVITNFDLRPVYNLYEEYFSDFDRFRINMIFSKDQKRFGYSYVSCREFSKCQLQEMYLKPFRFESSLSSENNYHEEDYRKNFMNRVNDYFQHARRECII